MWFKSLTHCTVNMYRWDTLQFLLFPELSKWTLLHDAMYIAIIFPALHELAAVSGEEVVPCSSVIETSCTQTYKIRTRNWQLKTLISTDLITRVQNTYIVF